MGLGFTYEPYTRLVETWLSSVFGCAHCAFLGFGVFFKSPLGVVILILCHTLIVEDLGGAGCAANKHLQKHCVMTWNAVWLGRRVLRSGQSGPGGHVGALQH